MSKTKNRKQKTTLTLNHMPKWVSEWKSGESNENNPHGNNLFR